MILLMPNLIFIKVFALTGLFLILSTLTRPTPVLASHKVFQDNFDDGNANGWIVTRNPCIYNGLPAEWEVVNGELGIKINGGGCVTEIMPNDGLWGSLGDDYSVEFDTHLVTGTDHNFAFRYTDPDHWYDYHIQSPGALIMQRMLAPENGSNVILGDFSNGQTIHFKIVVNGDDVKLYRGTNPELLLYDNPHMGGFFPTGRIALQASAGADPNSETYFDNIVVTNIDDGGGATLPVPYYTQNSLPWGPSEYDSAASLGISSPTMDRWGCAVTSAAMILKYHGMNEFANGKPMDPGNLNLWLDNNNGYQKRPGSSAIFWTSIQRLSKELFNAGKSNVKLVYSGHKPSSNTTTLLNNDLTTEKIPHILQVTTQWGSHYVVGTGVLNNGYSLNDPEWNYPDLSNFINNAYQHTHRYRPSQTNFSYIEFVVDPNVEVLITDSQVRKTGKRIVNGQTQEFFEIPNADYYFEPPIGNPNDEDLAETLGSGINRFLLPEPADGKYSLLVTSTESANYSLEIHTLESDGDYIAKTLTGTVSPITSDSYQIQYSQTSPSVINVVITFQSTIDDINQARNDNLITRDSLASNLIRIIEKAEDNVLDGRLVLALRRLEQFERTINRNRGDEITEKAYQVLHNDVSYLMEHL